MSCTCHATPHEHWCAEAPKGMDVGEFTNFVQGAGLPRDKKVMVDFGGNYLPVASARSEFHRGEFVLVIGVVQ